MATWARGLISISHSDGGHKNDIHNIEAGRLMDADFSTSTTNRAKVCGYVAYLLGRFSTDLNEIGHAQSVGVREQSREVGI